MRLTCPVLERGTQLPRHYAHDGGNVSPPLHWQDVPGETRELAVIFENTTPDSNAPFTQWLVYHIEPSREGLPGALKKTHEREEVSGVMEGVNANGSIGYEGPHGSEGRNMHYRFKLFALDRPLPAHEGLTKDQFMREIDGHILAEAECAADYEKPRGEETDL